ncbi:hypothetical protein FIV42_26390 [Persicimonas caeni]|uniref:Uncharacterized protein n=1 Tax=Persicimonas caeni TaxID=2292766 RepID=A0A4Y6Q0U4_PERCE|nr:hypothetical protein [Persicimonas caeni]QDG54142.1 hypothetical protein FIV42_26390 [Persicimonas caeni]QED35363.1 hypothetical protein FRD00_26385 [Persicimonas caeni]
MSRLLGLAAAFCLALTSLSLGIDHGHAQSSKDRSPPKSQEVPSIEGVWAQKFVTTSISDPPVIGTVTSRTISFQKLSIEQNAGKLTISETPCDVRVVSDQNAVETTIPDQFVDHMGTFERDGRLVRRDDDIYLYVPKHLKFYGVRSSLGTDELPRSKGASAVYDQDKDGHPGVTIRLSGVLSGELFVIQRSWDDLRGKLLSNGEFAGHIDWHTDQIVLEKTGRIFGEMEAAKPHPDKKQSYFRMVKVDDSTTCQEIARKGDKLFD